MLHMRTNNVILRTQSVSRSCRAQAGGMAKPMNYFIIFFTDERVVRSTSWDNSLDAAERYVRNQLGIEAVRRVEI